MYTCDTQQTRAGIRIIPGKHFYVSLLETSCDNNEEDRKSGQSQTLAYTLFSDSELSSSLSAQLTYAG